jgi:outer membrane protein assembly factor BamE (lipoprotein component of BamABCDE complex)
MKRVLIFLFGVLLALEGCYYTIRSTEGTKISAAQVQEIKLGKTTDIDLLKILGAPSKKEVKPDGTEVFRYIHTTWENPTLLGGYVLNGFFVRETKEIFEIILKDQVVQSYHFLRE